MKNRNQSKYILIAVIILILAGLLYISKFKNKNSPYQVLMPPNYESGTTVSLYKNIPPDFPTEIILENKELDYSGEIITPQGKKVATVSYISERTLQDLASMYKESLSKNGWNVGNVSISKKIAIIESAREAEILLVTMAPLKNDAAKIMVTFQYEK